LAIPPGADAELQAPAGEVVDAGDLLGGEDRVALDDEADPTAHAKPGRRLGRRGERDEEVVAVPVLGRQMVAAAPRALAARRDVGVLGEEQRLVAAILEPAGEPAGREPVVGREVADAEGHRASLCMGQACATAGRMFALRWKTFSGSYSALMRARRSYLAAP